MFPFMYRHVAPKGGAKIMNISIRHHIFCTKSIKTCIFIDVRRTLE